MVGCMYGILGTLCYILMMETPIVGSVCTESDRSCRGYSYCVSTEEVTYEEAGRRCQAIVAGSRQTGHLVVVDNEDKWTFIKELAGGVRHWIGLSTQKDITVPGLTLTQRRDGWTWVNSAWYNPSWNKWLDDSINGPYPLPLAQCAYQDENGNWNNNLDCVRDTKQYICQVSGGSTSSCLNTPSITPTPTPTPPAPTPTPTTQSTTTTKAPTVVTPTSANGAPALTTSTPTTTTSGSTTRSAAGGGNATSSEGKGGDQNVGPTLLYIVIGAIAGGLVLIAIILATVICCRSKTKGASNDDREKTEVNPIDHRQSGENAAPFFFTPDGGTAESRSPEYSMGYDSHIPQEEEDHYDRLGRAANQNFKPIEPDDDGLFSYPTTPTDADSDRQSKINSVYIAQYPEDADDPYAVVSPEYRASKKEKIRQSIVRPKFNGDVAFHKNEMYAY